MVTCGPLGARELDSFGVVGRSWVVVGVKCLFGRKCCLLGARGNHARTRSFCGSFLDRPECGRERTREADPVRW